MSENFPQLISAEEWTTMKEGLVAIMGRVEIMNRKLQALAFENFELKSELAALKQQNSEAEKRSRGDLKASSNDNVPAIMH